MSYEARDDQNKRDILYKELKSARDRIEAHTADWLSKAAVLMNNSPLQEDKDDIRAQVTGLKSALKATLGV